MLSKPRFDRSIDLVNKTKETTRFIFNAGKIKKRGISAFFAKFRGILAILQIIPKDIHIVPKHIHHSQFSGQSLFLNCGKS